MMNGEISHDRITRFLSQEDYTGKELWQQVKPVVRRIENESGCLIFDDTIFEKPWTDESELNCWHFDHCSGRSVKGVNVVTALYTCEDVSIPVDFMPVHKPAKCIDAASGKEKRRSEVTKNEMVRGMIQTAVANQIQFRYVLLDSWYASGDNFVFILKKRKHFVAALKDNRLVALSSQDRAQGRFVRVDSLQLSDRQLVRGWLKGFDKEVLIVRRVFTNKDGSTGRMNLVCSDLSLNGAQVADLYQKRWKIEAYHKSLKSNAGAEKSPTRTIRTQNNHIFMAIYAVFKLECLKIKHNLNHFALRMKRLIQANRHAWLQLQSLKRA